MADVVRVLMTIVDRTDVVEMTVVEISYVCLAL